MMFKTIAALSLASFAFASPQIYGPPPGPATTAASSSSAAPATPTNGAVIVQVGNGENLGFMPSEITAPNGTIVTFVYGASIPHSVTQSNMSNPCSPLPNGFSSGLTQGTTFSITVTNDQDPIYFFCEFPAHCGLGMVGTINAPSSGSGSNAAFASAALAVGAGEAVVANTMPVTGGVDALATNPPSAGTSVSGAAPAASQSNTPSGAANLAVSNIVAVLGAVAAVFGLAL